MPPDSQLRDFAGFVGRVVQDLNFEQLPRIVEAANGLNQPVGDVHLVVNRKLNRDHRQRVERLRFGWLGFLMPHVKIHEVGPMPAVHGQNAQDEEIADEDDCVRGSHAVSKVERENVRRLYSNRNFGRLAAIAGPSTVGQPDYGRRSRASDPVGERARLSGPRICPGRPPTGVAPGVPGSRVWFREDARTDRVDCGRDCVAWAHPARDSRERRRVHQRSRRRFPGRSFSLLPVPSRTVRKMFSPAAAPSSWRPPARRISLWPKKRA